MDKKDLITVVVPAYNHQKYIEECINSIINQTYENIELIIVNDGSNDGTAEKIKSKSEDCKGRFKRFLFIDKEHEGVAKTLNRGCFESKGKFLALCASDDFYTNDAIETMYDVLKNNQEYVLAVGDNYFIDSMSKRCYWKSYGKVTYETEEAEYKTFGDFLKKNRYEINFNSDEFGTYQSLLKGNYIPNGYLFRREVFVNRVKGYSEKPSLEDFFLHLQLSKYGKYKFIDKHLFNYRWHPKNSVKNRELMIKLTDLTFDLEKEFEHFYQIEKLVLRIIDSSEEYNGLKSNSRKIADVFISLLEMYPEKSEFNFLAFKKNNFEEDKRNLEEDERRFYSEYIQIKNSRIWRYSALFRKIVDQMKLIKIFSILNNSKK